MPRFNNIRTASGNAKPSGRIGAGDWNDLVDEAKAAFNEHEAKVSDHGTRLGIVEAAVVPTTLQPLTLSALAFDEDLEVGGVVARLIGTTPPGVSISVQTDGDLLALSGSTLTLARSVLLDGLLEYVVTLRQTHPAVPQPLVQSFVLACRRPNKVPIVRDEAATATAGTLRTVNVVANDTDPDGVDLHISEIVSVSGGCTATVNADGVSIDFLAPSSFVGTSSVVYRVSDGELTADGTLTVTVSAAAAPTKTLTLNDANAVIGWVAPQAVVGNVTVQHNVTAFPIQRRVTTTSAGTGAAATASYNLTADPAPMIDLAGEEFAFGTLNLTPNADIIWVDDANTSYAAGDPAITGVRFNVTGGRGETPVVASGDLPDLARGFSHEFRFRMNAQPSGTVYLGGFGHEASGVSYGYRFYVGSDRMFRFQAWNDVGTSFTVTSGAYAVGAIHKIRGAWEPVSGAPGTFKQRLYINDVLVAEGASDRTFVPTLVAGSARLRLNGNLGGTAGAASVGAFYGPATFSGYKQGGTGATVTTWEAIAPNQPHSMTEAEAEELKSPTTGITSYTQAGQITFTANGGAINETFTLAVGTQSGGGTGNPAPAGTSLTFNGQAAPLTLVDRLTTRSGVYTIYEAQQPDSRLTVEVWVNSLKSDAARLVVWRDPIDKVSNGPDDYAPIDLLQFTASVTHGGVTSNYTATVGHSSARWLENKPLADANPAWLREAMSASKRDVLPYNRNQGLNGYTRTAFNHDADRLAHVFDPMTLGPRLDGTAGAATAAFNYAGRLDKAGGEYDASRSFLHNTDCGVIDRARANEDSWFTAANLTALYNYSRYCLAFPAAVPFGKTCKATVDPQKPQPGESPYEIAYWNSQFGDGVRSYYKGENTAGGQSWDRDSAHLENTGYAHFLLTEDPLVAMLINRQTAFSFAWVNWGDRTSSRGGPNAPYAIQLGEERGSWNAMSSAFKSWRCALKIQSENGTHVWPASRCKAMLDDALSCYYEHWVAPAKIATDPASRDYKARIASAHGCRNYNVSYTDRNTPAGTLALGLGTSVFELQVYGGEILYLMTKHGVPLAEEVFGICATYLSNRIRYYQGNLAFRHTSSSGSGFIYGPGSDTPASASLDSPQEFAAWCAQYNGLTSQSATPFSKDNFTGAFVNQVLTARQFLRLADAHFAGQYAAALTEFARCEANTTFTTSGQRFKCMSTPA